MLVLIVVNISGIAVIARIVFPEQVIHREDEEFSRFFNSKNTQNRKVLRKLYSRIENKQTENEEKNVVRKSVTSSRAVHETLNAFRVFAELSAISRPCCVTKEILRDDLTLGDRHAQKKRVFCKKRTSR